MTLKKCSSQGCENLAFIRVYWPGQTVDKCVECATKAKSLSQVMGFSLSMVVLNLEETDDGTKENSL